METASRQILYVDYSRLSLPSPNTGANECGLIVGQSIFGHQTQHCAKVRKGYNPDSGLTTDELCELFQSYGIQHVSFRLISVESLPGFLKPSGSPCGYLAIVFLQTRRYFMRAGHFTFIYCNDKSQINILEITTRGPNGIPFDQFMEMYGYDVDNIQILQGVKLPNPMNEAIVTFPTKK